MEDFIYAIILLISMIVGRKNLEFRVKILKEGMEDSNLYPQSFFTQLNEKLERFVSCIFGYFCHVHNLDSSRISCLNEFIDSILAKEIKILKIKRPHMFIIYKFIQRHV